MPFRHIFQLAYKKLNKVLFASECLPYRILGQKIANEIVDTFLKIHHLLSFGFLFNNPSQRGKYAVQVLFQFIL